MVSNVEEALKKAGWNVSSSSVTDFLSADDCTSSNDSIDAISKKLLDLDLNPVGLNFKNENNSSTKVKAETLSGPLVLQIQKIRNVSAPKANETSHAAPQLLKVTVTDGQATYQILQMGNWNIISLDTPPGTKLLLKPGNTCRVHCGFVPLKQNQFSVMGGSVAGLIEKWQITKVFGLNNRHRDNHAPKWVPFGQKLVDDDLQVTTEKFKSLELEAKQAKENEAFDQQRQANIEEIAKALDVKKKSFAKSKPPPVDLPIERPGDRYRGNQRQGDFQTSRPGRNESSDQGRQRNERRGNSRREERDDPGVSSLPSKSTTLFDFLTNKLTDGEAPTSKSTKSNDMYDQGSDRNDNRGYERRHDRSGFESSRTQQSGARPQHNYKSNQSDQQYGRSGHNIKEGNYPALNETRTSTPNVPSLKAGDKVLAKYWEDQQMHRAEITGLGEAGHTCVIRFVDYDNYEEVLLTDVQACPLQKWDNYRPGVRPQHNTGNQMDNSSQRPRSAGYQGRNDGAGYQRRNDGGYQGRNDGGYHGRNDGGYQGRNDGGYQGRNDGGHQGRSDGGHQGGYRGRNDGGHQGRNDSFNRGGGGGAHRGGQGDRYGGAQGDDGGNTQGFQSGFEFRRGGKQYVQSGRGDHQGSRGDHQGSRGDNQGSRGDHQGSRGGQPGRQQGTKPDRQVYQPPRQRRD